MVSPLVCLMGLLAEGSPFICTGGGGLVPTHTVSVLWSLCKKANCCCLCVTYCSMHVPSHTAVGVLWCTL